MHGDLRLLRAGIPCKRLLLLRKLLARSHYWFLLSLHGWVWQRSSWGGLSNSWRSLKIWGWLWAGPQLLLWARVFSWGLCLLLPIRLEVWIYKLNSRHRSYWSRLLRAAWLILGHVWGTHRIIIELGRLHNNLIWLSGCLSLNVEAKLDPRVFLIILA